jgi:membrane-associated phospholipid phosphatase
MRIASARTAIDSSKFAWRSIGLRRIPPVHDVQPGTTLSPDRRLVKKYSRCGTQLGLACAFLLAYAAPAAAESQAARHLAEDARLYFTAPVRWDKRDWLHVGETLAVIGVAHQYDDDVRAHFMARLDSPNAGNDANSLRDALPAAAIVAGTWAAAFLLQDADGYEEGREMLEAAGFSAVSTTLIKYAAGRRRPFETDHVDDWSHGGDSFPSLHASAAFAIGTVLAESGSDNYRWLRRFLGYGVAGATVYVRLRDNVHWFSDTVAGAAVGIATAHFVMNRGDTRDRRAAFSLLPTEGGLMLTYNATL